MEGTLERAEAICSQEARATWDRLDSGGRIPEPRTKVASGEGGREGETEAILSGQEERGMPGLPQKRESEDAEGRSRPTTAASSEKEPNEEKASAPRSRRLTSRLRQAPESSGGGGEVSSQPAVEARAAATAAAGGGSRVEQRGWRVASIARLPDLPPSRRCDPAVPWMQRKGGAAPGGLSGASSGRGCAPFFDCPPLATLARSEPGQDGIRVGSSLFSPSPRRRQQPAERIYHRRRRGVGGKFVSPKGR